MATTIAEFTEGMTALRERVIVEINNRKRLVGAISADGRWGYDREGRNWVAFSRDPGRHPLPTAHHSSLDDARRWTFDHDHPVHTAAPEPRPANWSFR